MFDSGIHYKVYHMHRDVEKNYDYVNFQEVTIIGQDYFLLKRLLIYMCQDVT